MRFISLVSNIQRRISDDQGVVTTWLVGSGANKICLEWQAQVLQGDGAFGGSCDAEPWFTRLLRVCFGICFQTLQLRLQGLSLLSYSIKQATVHKCKQACLNTNPALKLPTGSEVRQTHILKVDVIGHRTAIFFKMCPNNSASCGF